MSAPLIPLSPLHPTTFSPFGLVVQNPSTHNNLPAVQATTANQGTATKHLDLTNLINAYPTSSPSARVTTNMFVCRPRSLDASLHSKAILRFGVLERHPFTPQTFIPLGLAAGDRSTRYLVIVAPTLPEPESDVRPSPTSPAYPGTGPPDLANVRAFVASGDQGVTYGAGTWHAPMVVIGEREVEFVVVQWANGVGREDCQEVYFDEGKELGVDVEAVLEGGVAAHESKARL